eukprot:TRINITY_DN27664_c0_g1_i2.p1 TRINITY_DN27664_c0_g1~~TRINITY_DN27664_c0_g1_i2.p1  ORF type:complete len:409 (-),score=71.88 TRINITY_DN27664_c0_g1_i2:58-1284(-)
MAPKRRSLVGTPLADAKSEAGKGLPRQPRGDEDDEKLDVKWGTSGTWLAHGQLPQRAWGDQRPNVPEAPFSVRGLELKPRHADDPTQLLSCWGIAAINTKGKKSDTDTALGQDNFSVACLEEGWEVFAVFDGHGKDGHWPATRSARALPRFLGDEKGIQFLQDGDIKSALEYAFKKTEAHIERVALQERVELACNGTTASVVVRHPEMQDRLWVGYVGDSRVALIMPDGSIVCETLDHKPTEPKESKRVLAAGADIRTTSEEGDSFINTRIFRPKESYPGLSMTRSLGDLCLKEFGVLATPEVAEWSLVGKQGAMLLLASDGVWEFLETADVASLVKKRLAPGGDKNKFLQELVNLSKAKWVAEDDEYCDDITAVLVPCTENLVAPRVKPASGVAACMAGICSLCSAK